MNDAELIEGCKAGKREALETIYYRKEKAGFLFTEMMQGGSYHDTGDPGFESMQVGGM